MELRIVFFLGILGLAHCNLLQLSCNQIKTFVNGHNLRRLRLANGEVPGQPAASEMKYMIWDDELAKKAANWASRYPEDHNPDKEVASGRFRTGENMFWQTTSNHQHIFDPDVALENWFNEYKDYGFWPIRRSGNGPVTGHYTQMAWSESTHVGCAVSQRLDNNRMMKFYVVCNYGPAGNYLGQMPYKTNSGAIKTLVCGNYDCRRPFGHC